MEEYKQELFIPSEQQKKAKEEFVDKNKTILKDDDLTTFPKPRSGCRHCYGRGYTGWDIKTGNTVVCNCVATRVGKVQDPEKLLTWGEFQKILYKKKDGTYEYPSKDVETSDQASSQNDDGVGTEINSGNDKQEG